MGIDVLQVLIFFKLKQKLTRFWMTSFSHGSVTICSDCGGICGFIKSRVWK